MKDKIERFAKGELEYEQPVLCLTEGEIIADGGQPALSSISITVEAGKSYEGSFIISNHMGSCVEGQVYSSNRLLQIREPSFRGECCVVNYSFQAAYRKAGETLQGEIAVVSDCGEAVIPFTVQVEQAHVMTSLGKIKDLFLFANLARADWAEAKKVFRGEEFERVFLSNEDRYRYLYRNLIKSSSASQALEEFLIAIHKKNVLRLEVDRTRLEYTVTGEEISDKVVLTRNHWGYAEIKVSTTAPFLKLEQKLLWADRFTGSTHPISFTIDPGKLRPGKHYGQIVIRCVYQTILVDVICRCPGTGRQESESRHDVPQTMDIGGHGTGVSKSRRLEAGFMESYLDFRLNRTGAERYAEKLQSILRELPDRPDSQVKNLIKVHLAMVSGRRKLAKELLEILWREESQGKSTLEKERLGRSVPEKKHPGRNIQVKSGQKRDIPEQSKTERESFWKGSPALEECAHLYLECLYSRDEAAISEAVGRIRRCYENGNRDWRILWFLLNLDSSYNKFPGNKLADIREQYELDCRSPILYYEAVCLLNKEPVLLRELDDFEIHIVNYGIRNHILAKELARQFIYLAGRRKTWHPVLFGSLTRLYREYADNDTLSAICSLLIKGMKRAEKYFEWFRLGVEAQLRITELYEYYMHCVSYDREEMISQPVLLYFIYNSNLNDRKKAYLYANIIRYKDRNEMIYRSYQKRMEIFAAEMLKAHQINKDLAVLYREFYADREPGAQLCGHLPYVMYRQEFYCDNPNIESVKVVHRELAAEETYPLVKGRAQIDIFTKQAQILLVDGGGNRYLESIPYKVTPYLNPEDYESRCLEHSGHPMLLLHLFDRYQRHRIMNPAAAELRKRVLLVEGLTDEYAAECQQALIEYYYENYNDELLEHYLKLLDLRRLKPAERSKYLEFIAVRRLYDHALAALETFGFDEIALNRLVKLLSGWMLTPEADHHNELMVQLCRYVYIQEKYDEKILMYLLRYYEGPEREMLKLWKTAGSFELEAHLLEERLLARMLYTRSDNPDSFPVFAQYYKEAANRMLVRAYLTYHAYRYLVWEQELPGELFPIMKRELNYEENEICLLAWLKHNVSNRELTGSELAFAEYQIDRLGKKELLLPFLAGYGDRMALPGKLRDKCCITHIADPGSRIYIHYRLIKQEEHTSAANEFITQRMTNVLLGIHVKELVLFHHETIEYYITEEYEGKETSTEMIYARYECAMPMAGDTKYNQINRMRAAIEQGDGNALLEEMESYIRKEYLASACFEYIGAKS
ncbi:hypothetical protein HNQ56_001949 [Anaerotaenia torta]|uniref:DUF5717 family protein n=1 Tax=Anaerotaenia torta TaxID=433293 RepID=UPI003D251FE6